MQAPTRATTLALEVRREKVKAITLVRRTQDDLFIKGRAMYTIDRALTRART